MPTPFSRSVRSLNSDSYRPSIVILVAALILVVLWLMWFFMARVTLYVETLSFEVRRDGYVRVTVDQQDLDKVQAGQSVQIFLDGDIGQQTGVIGGVVYEKRLDRNTPFVDIYATDQAELLDDLDPVPTGRAKIEVESVSPAVLMLRVSGQLIDSAPIFTSPQEGGS